MNSSQATSNKNNLIRNAIFAILLAAVVFFLGLYIPAILNDMDKGQPYTMSHVELFKIVELPTTSNSVTYDFVAKKNLDRLRIVLHFNKSYNTKKLENLYKNTHISIYDRTQNTFLYSGTIGNNFLELYSSPGVSVFVPHSSSAEIQKNHQYHITIEKLPPRTELYPAYNSFILVIGQIEREWP